MTFSSPKTAMEVPRTEVEDDFFFHFLLGAKGKVIDGREDIYRSVGVWKQSLASPGNAVRWACRCGSRKRKEATRCVPCSQSTLQQACLPMQNRGKSEE